jgi:DNA-binding NtrC family response regulator
MKEWTGVVTVLSVSPIQEDHLALEHLLALGEWVPRKWALHASCTFESAVTALQEDRVPIILSECDLDPNTWRDLLQYVSLFSDPPLVIVTSRLADERLWVEALNLGAYDVLAKPFNSDEVYRVLESAWCHWANRREAVPERPKQSAAVGS